VYEGYVIPKDTIVVASNWNISLNALYYPFPEIFEPARFLSPEHPLFKQEFKGEKHPHKTGHNAFGWGRRACPGEGLATNTLWIAVAKMCWAFAVEKCEGGVYDMEAYVGGLTVRPRDFKCVVKVRDADRKEVIEREKGVAERVLEAYPAYD
jgi:cytochrome P450